MRGRFSGLDEIALSSPMTRSDSPAGRRLELMRMQTAWRVAVGPRLGHVGVVHGFRDGTLSVDVRDTAWRKELERHEGRILRRLGELLAGQPVRKITFRVSARTASMPEPASPVGATKGGGKREGPIDDADSGNLLRERFEQVMIRYLSRR